MERRLERRLKDVYSRIKKERESTNINNDLKLMLDEFRRSSREDLCNIQQAATEAEKMKTQNELIFTKKRLAELEESKNGLATQVQSLKEQLTKFEHFNRRNQYDDNNNYNKINLEKEIESLKAELNKNKSFESTNEVVRTIEKYERQKEYLTENNQALKVLLKEKEMREVQLKNDLKTLQDKNEQMERNNGKLQAELEHTISKLNEISGDSEKYSSYLRACEEQLNLSEKKRDELKQDAQETIKL